MVQALIHLEERHDKIINEYSLRYNLSKHDAILKIIESYKFEEEKKDGNR